VTAATTRSSTSAPRSRPPAKAALPLSPAKRKRARWIAIAVLATVVVAMGLLLIYAPSTRKIIVYIAHLVRSLGDWGPVAFAAIYAACCVTLVPAAPMSIIAGILFGWRAMPLVMAAAMTGAMFSFMVARYLLRDRLLRYLEHDSTLRVIDKAVVNDGWKIVVLFRVSPLIPFNLQNYILGATRIKVWTYITSTFIGIIPGTAVFVYLGAAFGKAAFSTDKAGPYQWTLLVLGLIATIIVTWLVTKRARERLARVGVRRN
jgi:uncharacterized membrane protein YdjX (TVP38/TMEM64 family)